MLISLLLLVYLYLWFTDFAFTDTGTMELHGLVEHLDQPTALDCCEMGKMRISGGSYIGGSLAGWFGE